MRDAFDLSEGGLRSANLTLSPESTCIQWQDRVETAGDGARCSGWPGYISLHTSSPQRSTKLAGIAVLPVEPLGVSSAQSAEDQSSAPHQVQDVAM